MAVPWLQIVQLVPSILDVSRELLKKTSRMPPGPPGASQPQDEAHFGMRIAALEENERRQAELVSQMAEQLAGLARAVTVLHTRVIWLTWTALASALIAIVALVMALR